MVPQKKPETSDSKILNQLSPSTRAEIVVFREEGLSFGEIASRISCPLSTVKSSYYKWRTQGTVYRKKITTSRKMFSDRQERQIYRYMQNNPLATKRKIIDDLGLPARCHRTLLRLANDKKAKQQGHDVLNENSEKPRKSAHDALDTRRDDDET